MQLRADPGSEPEGTTVMAIVCDTCGAKFTDWETVPPVPEDSPFLDIDPGCPKCPLGIPFDHDDGDIP